MSEAQHTPAPTGLDINVKPTTLPKVALENAKPLLGFDYGADMFHVMLFDFEDDGGAVGIWREGDDFCARITLDSLAEFWFRAKANAAIARTSTRSTTP